MAAKSKVIMDRRYMKVGPQDLTLIHTLRDAGVSRSGIKKLTGRSSTVIDILAKANDMEEYFKLSKEYWNRNKEQREVVSAPIEEGLTPTGSADRELLSAIS